MATKKKVASKPKTKIQLFREWVEARGEKLQFHQDLLASDFFSGAGSFCRFPNAGGKSWLIERLAEFEKSEGSDRQA